jgi:hypothetical protein
MEVKLIDDGTGRLQERYYAIVKTGSGTAQGWVVPAKEAFSGIITKRL